MENKKIAVRLGFDHYHDFVEENDESRSFLHSATGFCLINRSINELKLIIIEN